ncbi:type VI secretion system membrane subunit TssM [uncultured Pseudacidovorax sp.]|uniref:type VI secretion system membrane subunit TssM n=1 Tax=uncultured Pseudacidovorax sp. TaxID=679313 RepID=UPI0025D954B5|nr:type VI secretion system membrane subunit TssM [uncultured Pseudacidovorax sp.]
MQYLKQFLGYLFSRQMLAFVGVVLLALLIWFVGPLIAVDGLRPLGTVGVRVSVVVLLLLTGILWLVSGPVSLIGVAALCLLIWHAGPLLSLGSAQPLAPAWIRATLVGVLLLVCAVYWLYVLLRLLQANPSMLENLFVFGKDRGKDDVARQEIKDVTSIVNRAMAQLKGLRARGGMLRRVLEGKRYLYELPWYMIVGSAGAGKTTAVLNSGLQFPLARKGMTGPRSLSLQSPAGTVHCDWWLTNEAVLIDTAGRYTTQDSTPAADAAEWHGFLGLLRKHRTRAPINGAIVALDASDLLLLTPAERAERAGAVRERLAELREELGIRFPVYVMVTKTDLLCGFHEYFQSLTSEGRAQVWGFTLPFQGMKAGRPADMAAHRDALRTQIGTELGLLKQRLDEGLRIRLSEEFDPERRRKLFALPGELAGLVVPLVQVLDDVFLDSRFDNTQAHNTLRGVYFTSGAQAEVHLPADPETLLQRLWRSLGVSPLEWVRKAEAQKAAQGEARDAAPSPQPEAAAAPAPTQGTSTGAADANDSNALGQPAATAGAQAASPVPRPAAAPAARPSTDIRLMTQPRRGLHGYFLQDLMTKVIIPESHLVRPNLRWEFRFRLLRLLGHALAIVVFLWLAGALALSFGNNRQYLGTIGQRAQGLAAQVRGLYAQFKPSAVPDVLNSARELPAYAGLDFVDPPGSFLYGLYSVPPVLEASAATYASLQDHLLLPAILQRMEAVLAQSVKDKDAKTAYETLRVYKLLHDKERYMSGGARDVRNWVLKDWEASDSAAVFGGRASMVGHVEALFSGDRPVQSASLPKEGLVREVQDFLNANTSTQRVYERAKAAMAPEAPQEFTLVRAVGPQVGTVLARVDGQPLEKGVPGLFTYDGYHALFNKRLGEFVEKALEEDAWVMGRTGAGALAAAAQKKTLSGNATDSLRGNPLLEDIRRQYLTEYAQSWSSFLDSVRVVSSRDETNTSLGFDLSVLRQLAAPDSPLARLARAAARETTLSRPLATSAREEDKSFLDKASDALDKKSRELGKNLGIRPEERLEKQLVDDQFAALREVVTGQPDIAMEGGAGAASAKPGLENISGLLNEYYTALVVADTALTAGSLPPGGTELGARLKLEAGKLPAPFREVLTALAVNGGDKVTLGATAILRKQAQLQLDRIMGLMAMQVSEPCKRGVEGRYPLAAVDQDASIEDFTAVFAAGGAADEFFNKYLAPFVDTSVRPWRYKDPSVANAMVGAEAAASGGTPTPATTGPTMLGELLKLLARSGPSLDAFYRAQQIREVFFREAGGRKLSWKMDLRVLELEPSITDLVIDIDGQGLRYVHGPVQPFAVSWPGPRGGSMAELSANPRISGPTSTILQQGPWALFRLLEKGRIVQTATPGRLSVEYSFDGRKALIDIGTGSQANPLNSDLLKGFRCPGRVG